MKKITKILLIIPIFFIIITVYGLVLHLVFGKSTFLSRPIDCMPRISGDNGEIIDNKPDPRLSLWAEIFGFYCGSY